MEEFAAKFKTEMIWYVNINGKEIGNVKIKSKIGRGYHRTVDTKI